LELEWDLEEGDLTMEGVEEEGGRIALTSKILQKVATKWS